MPMSHWKRIFLLVAMVAPIFGCSSSPVSQTSATKRAPNILLIVADDLGYSDLGAFGGEIDTPHLNSLALAGVRFTDFYTAPTCSPTRAMLMTGNDNHLVGLGTMGEMLPPDSPRTPGYEGYLNSTSMTMAEIFRKAGYRTMMSGKWHLGKDEGQTPTDRGFHRSYVLLDGAAGHFGLPGDSIKSQIGVSGGYREDGQIVDLPNGRYAGDVYTDRLLDYMAEAQSLDRPFFAYLAFTEPHWPLQAPGDLIEKYRGRYDAGPETLRQERLNKMVALDLIEPDDTVHEPVKSSGWSSMSREEQQRSARAMEIYAAMVDSLDQNVGRILDHLERSNQLDNTIVLFMSDNGADGVLTETLLLGMRPTDDQLAAIDNSLDNLGQPDSYIAYGPEWAQVSSAPFNRFKVYTTEGGIRVPAFVTGPGIPEGEMSAAFLHVRDVLPTLVEMAGILPAYEEGRLPPNGKSFAPVLEGKRTGIHDSEPIGWELFGGRALRVDNWKAVMLPPKNNFFEYGSEKPEWMLFDLAEDVGETEDLSGRYPDKLREMIHHWYAYAIENGVIVQDDVPSSE